MKKVKITQEYEGYEQKCSQCDKIVQGRSPSQVLYRLTIHELTHRNKEESE